MQTMLQLDTVHAQPCAMTQVEQLQPFDECGTRSAHGPQEPTGGPAVAADSTPLDKIQVSIEVSLVATSTAPVEEVRQRLQKLLSRRTLRLHEARLQLSAGEDEFLDKHVHEICITADGLAESHVGRSFFAWELDFCIRHARCS